MNRIVQNNEHRQDVFSVTELTRRVKSLLESGVGSVWVAGEISNLRVPSSGHMYFTLKDERSQIAAVMFRTRNQSLRIRPENGLEFVVHGLVTVYEARGQYQIIVDRMEPCGVGALQLAFEQLKKKLSEEGLFDESHKVAIPALPRRIGLVTSPTGAAIRDILSVIRRRFSGVHLLLYPVRVQGDEAPNEIVEAIDSLDSLGDIDVIIVGRGGGSIEDLWAFNDENVARAIYRCATPVISAVGHEIDFTISDFVADLRAPTPSAAAELVVSERDTMQEAVRRARRRLVLAIRRTVETAAQNLRLLEESYLLQRPEQLFMEFKQRVDELGDLLARHIRDQFIQRSTRLGRCADAVRHLRPQMVIAESRARLDDTKQRLTMGYRQQLGRLQNRYAALDAKLEGLSPLAVLARGYSVVWNLSDGELVRDASQLTAGDHVKMRFRSGRAAALIEDTDPD